MDGDSLKTSFYFAYLIPYAYGDDAELREALSGLAKVRMDISFERHSNEDDPQFSKQIITVACVDVVLKHPNKVFEQLKNGLYDKIQRICCCEPIAMCAKMVGPYNLV